MHFSRYCMFFSLIQATYSPGLFDRCFITPITTSETIKIMTRIVITSNLPWVAETMINKERAPPHDAMTISQSRLEGPRASIRSSHDSYLAKSMEIFQAMAPRYSQTSTSMGNVAMNATVKLTMVYLNIGKYGKSIATSNCPNVPNVRIENKTTTKSSWLRVRVVTIRAPREAVVARRQLPRPVSRRLTRSG